MGWKWKHPGRGTEYDGLYQSWKAMINRAGNKDSHHPTYANVTVCDRWKSYDNFFEDMHKNWFKGASIDKDSINAGNRTYCKEYCKWITRSENSKERNNRCGNPAKREDVRQKLSKYMIGNKTASKKVKCIETGEIFESAADAEKSFSLPKFSVSNAANPNNHQKTAGGYHWKYINIENK